MKKKTTIILTISLVFCGLFSLSYFYYGRPPHVMPNWSNEDKDGILKILNAARLIKGKGSNNDRLSNVINSEQLSSERIDNTAKFSFSSRPGSHFEIESFNENHLLFKIVNLDFDSCNHVAYFVVDRDQSGIDGTVLIGSKNSRKKSLITPTSNINSSQNPNFGSSLDRVIFDACADGLNNFTLTVDLEINLKID